MQLQDKERIEQFISINEKIKNSRFVRETKSISFNLRVGVGKPLEQNLSGFDEDDLRSMLMDLRKFTIKRDDVYLPQICDLLINHSSDQTTIKNIEKCKDLYNQLMKEPAVKMIIESDTESGKSVLDKWLYGHYIHEKQHKQDLQKLGIGQQFHKANFIWSITELIKISSWVSNNAKNVLGTAGIARP